MLGDLNVQLMREMNAVRTGKCRLLLNNASSASMQHILNKIFVYKRKKKFKKKRKNVAYLLALILSHSMTTNT